MSILKKNSVALKRYSQYFILVDVTEFNPTRFHLTAQLPITDRYSYSVHNTLHFIFYDTFVFLLILANAFLHLFQFATYYI